MFDRPRRNLSSRTRRHPTSSEDTTANKSNEPWVAVAIDALIEGAKRPQAAVSAPRAKPEPPLPRHYPHVFVLPVVMLASLAAIFLFQGAIRSALSESWIAGGTMASLERATVIASNNPLAWLRLGLRQSKDGDAVTAAMSLEQVVHLSPSNSSSRIALGLELERAGRLAEAEKALLDAAAVHNGFAPRWSLTNYYQRRNDWEQVWRWANEAIRSDPSQLVVVASLCWRANVDPATILDRVIPDLPGTNRAYFGYLYDLGRLDAMRQAWGRFSKEATTSESRLALQYIDRLIAAGFITEAVESWNLLCDRALLPHAPIDPVQGRYLTNPYFLTDPSGNGFDWRSEIHRGISWYREAPVRDRGALEFRLSGAQTNGITMLAQSIPAVSGVYRLGFEFATQGMPIYTGVGWRVSDLHTKEVLRPFESLNNAEGFWDTDSLTFSVPEGTKAIALELLYQDQDLGTRRLGSVRLRNLGLSVTVPEGLPTP